MIRPVFMIVVGIVAILVIIELTKIVLMKRFCDFRIGLVGE